MFLFVTIAKSAVEATAGVVPVQQVFHFTAEHLISTLVGFLLMGLIAPILSARRIRKEQAKEDERADELKKRDAERAALLKERDDARAFALKTKDEAKEEVDTNWHNTVRASFDNLSGQVQAAMKTNKDDTDALWKALKEHGHVIKCKGGECREITISSVLFQRGVDL